MSVRKIESKFVSLVSQQVIRHESDLEAREFIAYLNDEEVDYYAVSNVVSGRFLSTNRTTAHKEKLVNIQCKDSVLLYNEATLRRNSTGNL